MLHENRVNNFNLLRFLFAGAVILSHVPELHDGNRSNEILSNIFGTISFGELAVDSFFIISGFLIVKSWIEKPRIIPFLASRILRIYPGFIVASLLCVLVVGPIYGAPDYFETFKPLRYIFSLAMLDIPAVTGVFVGSHYPFLNESMWSISYEFKCYLLVLVCGLLGIIHKRYLWLLIALLSSAVYLIHHFDILKTSFVLYARCLMAFTYGGCFYLYGKTLIWKRSYAFWGLLVLGGLLFNQPIAEPAICLLWGYAVIFFALNSKALLSFNRFPDISYGIYLYSWPITKIVLWHSPGINVWVAVLIVFMLSMAAGAASWYCVEKPFIRLKRFF